MSSPAKKKHSTSPTDLGGDDRAVKKARTQPLRIDIHTHILPKDIPDLASKFGYGTYIHLDHHKKGKARMMKGETFFREIEANCWCCKERAADCDRTDVDVQVLSTVPVMFNYHIEGKDCLYLSQFLNDHIAGCVKDDPSRFLGLGTVPMQSPDLAAKELERCVTELGLCGVEIGSHINKWNLDEKELDPFWEAAERLGAAVFVHPWDMPKDLMPKYWLPWLVGMPMETALAMSSVIFGGVLERFPKLKLAFAHGGGAFPFTIGRLEKGFKCRPDLVAVDNDVNPREYIGKIWTDSLVHDEKALKYLVDLMGSKRVCLGSDYPFPLGEQNPGETILKADLGEEVTKDLFHNAALEFLGISRDEAKKRFGK